MPTLITPRTRFLHVPKTGGTWAWGALQAAGVPVELLDRPQNGVLGWHCRLARAEHEIIERFYPLEPVRSELLAPDGRTQPPTRIPAGSPRRPPSSVSPRVPPVVILGMHRTGTSAVASIVRGLGFDLGEESALMPAHPYDNPRGFFEHTEISVINDELLAALGGSWWQPPHPTPGWEGSGEFEALRQRAATVLGTFGEAWAIKDPRLSLTLPFWRTLIGPAQYAVCVRHPAEVAASLLRRYRETVADPGPDALTGREWERLWSVYTDGAMRLSADAPRCVIDHQRLLTRPCREVERLGGWLGVPLGRERVTQLGQLVDPDLWRQQPQMRGLTLTRASRWRYRRISLTEARRTPPAPPKPP